VINKFRRRIFTLMVIAGLTAVVAGVGIAQASPPSSPATKGRSEVEAYAQTAREHATDAFDHQQFAPARVVFKHPVSAERFNEVMRQPGLSIDAFRIRVVEEDGTMAIIGGIPENDGTLIDWDHVAMIAQGHADRAQKSLEVLGVFDALVRLDRTSYDHLSSDDDVFLVDTTPEYAQQGGFFRQMEDAGMVEKVR
jgi:hypothetical protein